MKPGPVSNQKKNKTRTGPDRKKMKPRLDVKTRTGFLFQTQTRPEKLKPGLEGTIQAGKNKAWTQTGPEGTPL